MMRALAIAVAVAGCTASSTAIDNTDPDLDGTGGKADGATSATSLGRLAWGDNAVAFGDHALVYYTFALSDRATVSLETTGGAADTDTVLYVYRPSGDRWGAYVAKNDDGGAGKLSKLGALELEAGTYRALVKRKAGGGEAVALAAGCTGAGCQSGCTPLATRAVDPEVFVGPDAWQASIVGAIDAATTSLDVQMYLFDVTAIAQHVIDAQARGVRVRVLLDATQAANNKVVKAKLDAARVPNHLDPAQFTYAHAKYLIVDGATAVILSGNFNGGAVKTSGGGERNYGVVDRDPDDVADLQAIFASDWSGGPPPDLACTRLEVSPVNSKDRILAHVASATATLDIELLYLVDADIQAAVVAAATERGVAVRVLLSDPVKNPQNKTTRDALAANGIPVKFLLANYLHAKMIQADGVAHIGSENMSETSLTKNREVGALVFEAAPAETVHAQFEADWAAAVESD